uniref:Protein BUD31 homolog n=1 Tax=Oncorhynchus tshawytscha TaxID=74940 RepID=A0AAZ3NTU3_ONCTS
MPKVKRSRKPPPDGWELIEPTLDELDQKMREAETEPHEGKRKVESLLPIFRLHHQRSRYIFDLFYKRKAISRGRCYCYIRGRGSAENLTLASGLTSRSLSLAVCLVCLCLCLSPSLQGRIIECTHCGCRGCSG